MNRFIVAIEGIDGVGKGTQGKILVNRLISIGVDATLVSFPRYDSFFGIKIGKYLNGQYGELGSVPVDFPVLLFALDRWDFFNSSLPTINDSVLVIDRYVLSNIAHQAAKVSKRDQKRLINDILELEHKKLNIPLPNVVFLLDADLIHTTRQVLTKKRRAYTQKKMDIHEADNSYLKKARQIYLKCASLSPDVNIISCEDGKRMRTKEEIAEEIWSKMEPLILRNVLRRRL